MATRKICTATFKAMVAKEAMKEQSTLAELAKRYEVVPKLISVWIREAETRLEEVFRGATPSDDRKGTTEQIEKLRAKVGELTMERFFFEEACKRAGLASKPGRL